jgi:uncharacterized membrane protein
VRGPGNRWYNVFVEIHNALGQPQRIPCTRALICDDLGNALALAVEWQVGAFYVTTCNDPAFNQVLRNLGVGQTVICTDLHTTPLEEVRFDRTVL